MPTPAFAALAAEFRKLRERVTASLVWTTDNQTALYRTTFPGQPVYPGCTAPLFDDRGIRLGTWTMVTSLRPHKTTRTFADLMTLGGRAAFALPGVTFTPADPKAFAAGSEFGLAGDVRDLATEAGRLARPGHPDNPLSAWFQFVLLRSPNHLKPFPREAAEFPSMRAYWDAMRRHRSEQVEHLRWLEDALLRSAELLETLPPVDSLPMPATEPAAPVAIDPKVRNWLAGHYLSDPNPERIDGKQTAVVRFEAFRDMLLAGGFEVLATADACLAAGWIADLWVDVTEREEGDDGPSSVLGDALTARLGLTPGRHRIVGIYGTVCGRQPDAKPSTPPPPEPPKTETPKWDSLTGFLTARGKLKKVRSNGRLIRTILDAFERAKWPQQAVKVSALACTDDQKKAIGRFLDELPLDIRPDGSGTGLVWRWKPSE